MGRKFIINENPESHGLAWFLFFYSFYYMQPIVRDTALKLDGISWAPPPSVSQVIVSNGYPCDEHIAMTADGYLLDVERIPNEGPPVILLHGLADSSATWVMDNNPNVSLAHHLHDAGFDVWLGNTRGTQLSSRPHSWLSSSSAEFWQFNVDDMVDKDFPTLVNYVLNRSEYPTLGVVGHSLGAMIALSATTEDPDMEQKVNSIVALAAAADYSPSKINDLYNTPGLQYAPSVLSVCDDYPSLPFCGAFQPANLARKLAFVPVCRAFPLFCDAILCDIAGCMDVENFDSRIFQYYPTESSTRVINQLIQMNVAGQAQRFDYGAEVNKRVYNSVSPPLYQLEAKVPTQMFIGMADKLVTHDRLRNLAETLKGDMLKEVVELEGYGHADLCWGKDKARLQNPKVSSHLLAYAPSLSVPISGQN